MTAGIVRAPAPPGMEKKFQSFQKVLGRGEARPKAAGTVPSIRRRLTKRRCLAADLDEEAARFGRGPVWMSLGVAAEEAEEAG